MIYTDQHIHCQCSPDSHTPLREMAAAARDHGMSAVCFTDHIDMDFGNLGDLRWEAREDILRAAWADVRANPVEGITVRCGIELGEANHDPAAAKEAALEPGLDFVLGSLHNLRGKPDFYEYPYTSEEQCAQLNREYLAELLELTEFPYFDTMAHIGYTSRYMHRDGFSAEITAEAYRDELAAIYEALITQALRSTYPACAPATRATRTPRRSRSITISAARSSHSAATPTRRRTPPSASARARSCCGRSAFGTTRCLNRESPHFYRWNKQRR